MIRSFLGFDLSDKENPRLIRGTAFSILASLADALPWALMVFYLPIFLKDSNSYNTIVICSTLGIVGFIASCGFKRCALNDNFTATYSTVADIRLKLADHLAKLPLGRVLQRRDGTLSDLLTSQFSLYQDIITHVWGLIVAGTAFPIVLWLLLGFLDWRIAVIELCLVPFAFFTIPWAYRLLDSAGKTVTATREETVASVVEIVSGVRDLRFFDMKRQRVANAYTALDALKNQSMKTETAPAPALLSYGLMLNLITSVIMSIACLKLLNAPENAIRLFLSMLITLRLNVALTGLGIFLAELRFSRSILVNIKKVMAEPTLPIPQYSKQPEKSAAIEVNHVFFAYGHDEILRDISFVASPGCITAVVGPSGAGKSTLAQLIGRLWDVSRGSIRVGGVDLRDMNQETLNRTVSIVFQNIVLFDISITDNIRLGYPEASMDKVMEAAKSAYIHDRIMALPGGYNTVLSADSVVLSDGERQRLAIARALLKDSPVLILDEATASLDLENEVAIQQALSNLCIGRTVFVIAHRLWTICDADKIIVLDQGALVEQGNHRSLLAQNGLYAQLWMAQTGTVLADNDC